ncbi:uncharacterized protein V6R79_010508 [Siganus canaliculatus]
MAVKRSVLGLLLVLFTVPAWTEAAVVRKVTEEENDEDEEDQSVTEQPEEVKTTLNKSQLAFSRDNHQPTMVAVPDHSTTFGTGRKMSRRDVERINLLYCTG